MDDTKPGSAGVRDPGGGTSTMVVVNGGVLSKCAKPQDLWGRCLIATLLFDLTHTWQSP